MHIILIVTFAAEQMCKFRSLLSTYAVGKMNRRKALKPSTLKYVEWTLGTNKA